MAISLRRAGGADAFAVAELHADSWRRHYRGAYRDEFLDGPVVDERRTVWSSRLAADGDGSTDTILAEEDGALLGFVHVVHDAEPGWGSLVDNLHVAAAQQRRGLGRLLMAAAAEAVVQARPGAGIYLWVLEQNERARAFYVAVGATPADRRETEPPGGGRVTAVRMTWPAAALPALVSSPASSPPG